TDVGAGQRTIYTWEAATSKELLPEQGNSDMIWSVALSPDTKIVATADYRTIRFWDAATGRELRQCLGHPGRGDFIAFAPDGQTLASNCWDDKVRLWDVGTGKVVRLFEGAGTAN